MSVQRKVEVVAFVLGAMVLAFLFGYATRGFDLFPNRFIQEAWNQAEAVVFPESEMEAQVYDRSGVRVVREEEVQRGVTLLVSYRWAGSDGKPGARLIDTKGRLLHRWSIDPEKIFGGMDNKQGRASDFGRAYIHGSHLFPNGDLLINVEYWGTARLNACGEVLWRLAANSHHSIDRASDGTFWISANTPEPRLATPAHPNGLPGLETPVYQDRIIKVTADGSILTEINVLDLLYANGLERYIPKTDRIPRVTDQENPRDITHLNDVESLPPSMSAEYPMFDAGDLLISLKHFDLVVVADPESLNVKWHASEPFILQHDPDYMGNGWIGVFDNNTDYTGRGSMLGGSRIVAIRPATGDQKVLFPTTKSEHFYTRMQGKWQLLENGNLLLTESRAGRVVEVGKDGKTVWEWVHSPFHEGAVPAVTEGTRYDLARETVEAWPCSE